MALCDESLTLARELGYRRGIAIQLHLLGRVACAQHDEDKAAALHKESLQLFRLLDENLWIAWCREGLAGVASAQGQPRQAARLLGAAELLRGALRIPLSRPERAKQNRLVDSIRAALGEAEFAAARTEGQAMTLQQAIEYAAERG